MNDIASETGQTYCLCEVPKPQEGHDGCVVCAFPIKELSCDVPMMPVKQCPACDQLCVDTESVWDHYMDEYVSGDSAHVDPVHDDVMAALRRAGGPVRTVQVPDALAMMKGASS